MSKKKEKRKVIAPVRQNYTDQQIADALKESGGIISIAARKLNVKRKTFSNWVKSIGRKSQVKLDEFVPESTLKISKRKKQRYVVTSAQNNTNVHTDFWKALLKYCKYNNAQLIVVPVRYKNVTAFIEEGDYVPWWPDEVKPYLLNGVFEVNNNLVIMSDFKIQATAVNPLSGIGPIGGHRSVILGHAQLQLKMIPSPHYELPRQLLTTGSVSNKNYSLSKAGQKAQFHHTYGAIVCEVDGDVFWTRQLNATEDGSFYDLDHYYTATNDPVSGIRVAGLVCGDIHNDFLDDGVKFATWIESDSIANVCKPEHMFLHDVLDFYSANHHHKNNFFTKFAKAQSGMGNVERELGRLIESHNNIWGKFDSIIHYISSNHHDALTRWLNDANPKEDPENALFYHRMMVAMLEGVKMTPNGATVPNPLALYMRPLINNPDKTIFHKRDDRVLLHNIDLSQHGDYGANGSRGSLKSFANSGYKSIIGHSHTPGIDKGCYQVGTSSLLMLEYNRSGYSSWLHTHALIYPNGKRTLINIIKGRWRLV